MQLLQWRVQPQKYANGRLAGRVWEARALALRSEASFKFKRLHESGWWRGVGSNVGDLRCGNRVALKFEFGKG